VTDAVTVAFGDPAAGLCGLARAGSGDGGYTGLGVLFAGDRPAALRAGGGGAGVQTEVVEPLRRWRASFDGGEGGGFALELEALAAPAVLAADAAAAQAGGMEGYEQLCRVRGTVRVGAQERRIDCLGQRGHSWGQPNWNKIALARTVSAWLDDRTAVTLTAVRPAKAKHHADEALAAYFVEAGEPVPVADPRLSTTYDAHGHHRHAGLELWLTDEGGFAHRAAGELVCGTSIDLGQLQLDCAFFAWRMEGRRGLGRYDVVRRTA
jgi:hypothetical protein